MKKLALTALSTVALLLLFATVACPAATFQELKDQYNKGVFALEGERREKVGTLSKDYFAILEKLKQEAALRGDLDWALAARNEIDRVNRGQVPPPSNKVPSWLLPLQNKYEQAVQQATKSLSERADRLKQKYAQDLDTLQKQLTVAGDLDGAVAARAEKERMLGSASKPITMPGGSPTTAVIRPSRKPTADEITVLPFCIPADLKLDPKVRGMFDELTVEKSDQIHIHGTKRKDSAAIDGRVVFHLGKAALIPLGDKSGKPVDRSGKLVAKLEVQEDVRNYWVMLEFKDKLYSKDIKLEADKTYDWFVMSANGTTQFRIMAGKDEVAALKAPTEQIKGFGFAATVRRVKNQADLEVTFN